MISPARIALRPLLFAFFGAEIICGTCPLPAGTPLGGHPDFQVVHPPLETARQIVVGNFDGIGPPEIAAGRGEFVSDMEGILSLPNVIILHRALGGASLTPPYTRSTIAESDARCLNLTAGDFDGDGIDDLTYTLELPPEPDLNPVRQSYWARGRSGLGLGNPEPFSGESITWELTRALDIDGDGTEEILAHDRPHSVGLYDIVPINVHYLHQPSQSWFKATAAGAHNFDIEPLDFDGDGDLDILFGGRVAFVGSNNNLMLVENLGELNLWAAPVEVYSQGEPIYEFDFGDVTGDSRSDLIFALNAVQGYAPGLSGGGFGSPVYLPGAQRLPDALIFAEDVDGDSDLDIRVERHFQPPDSATAVTNYYPNLNGAGQMGARISLSDATPQRRIAANLDGAGANEELFLVDTEFPLASEPALLGEVGIRTSVGAETALLPTTFQPVSGIALLDVEPDGDLDVVVTIGGNDFLLLQEAGRLSLLPQPASTRQQHLLPTARGSLLTGDLNGDGLDDEIRIADGRIEVKYAALVITATSTNWMLY